MCGRPILIITRMITDRVRNPLVPLPLLIAEGSLDSAIFLSKYRSCKRPSCTDPAVTVAAIITWLQSKHNYAFWDLWNCWQTFRSRQLYKQLYRNWRTTLTYPTSRHYYQVRSRTFWAWRSKYFHYSSTNIERTRSNQQEAQKQKAWGILDHILTE